MFRNLMVIIGTLLCILLILPHATATTISNYDVTIDLGESSDGKLNRSSVFLEITYDVKEPKSSGYKFVGTQYPRNVYVYDEYGNELDFNVDFKKEYLIEWEFPEEISNQKYTVNVEFDQDDILKGDLKKNYIRLIWPGQYKSEVYNASYNLIFPEGYKFDRVKSKPSNYKVDYLSDGRWGVSIIQPHLSSKQFNFEFSPGLVDSPGGMDLSILRTPYLLFGVFVFIMIVGGFLKRRFFGRGRRGGGGGGAWDFFDSGGCSGCSSCGGCGGCGGCGD